MKACLLQKQLFVCYFRLWLSAYSYFGDEACLVFICLMLMAHLRQRNLRSLRCLKNNSIIGWERNYAPKFQIWMFLVFQYWIVYLLNLKHPNLDVSGLPILDCLFTHPNLDVSNLPLLECISWHSNLDSSIAMEQ